MGNYYNCVITDNYKIGKLAGEHLIANGHTKIAAIMGKQDEYTGKARFEGFLNALEENQIQYDETLYIFGDYKEESGKAAIKELLKIGGFTSVFIASSKMVYGAILALHEENKSIPQDISIVGVDVVDKYETIHPGITSVIQSENEIGRATAELLLDKINKPTIVRNNRIFLEPTLIKREGD